jgi:hypothetical protein
MACGQRDQINCRDTDQRDQGNTVFFHSLYSLNTPPVEGSS